MRSKRKGEAAFIFVVAIIAIVILFSFGAWAVRAFSYWANNTTPTGAQIEARNHRINTFATWAYSVGATDDDIDDAIQALWDQQGNTWAPAIPGDTDLDGDIDWEDFLKVSDNYGNATPGQNDIGASWSEGDMDVDGEVGFSDFLAVSENWNP